MQPGKPQARRQEDDAVLERLARLAATAGALHRRVGQFTELRAGAEWAEGLSYREMLPLRKRLQMVQEISAALRELTRDGYEYRRLEARALYDEGLTMAELATVFGVSRQRVSALLRGPAHGPARGEGAFGL